MMRKIEVVLSLYSRIREIDTMEALCQMLVVVDATDLSVAERKTIDNALTDSVERIVMLSRISGQTLSFDDFPDLGKI
jgi:hypothetical protein